MRRQDAQAMPPLTTVPAPEFLPGGVVRYRCPPGCVDWHHEERPGCELPGPLLLPAGYTSEDLTAALTSETAVRGNALRLWVEQAIAGHFTARDAER